MKTGTLLFITILFALTSCFEARNRRAESSGTKNSTSQYNPGGGLILPSSNGGTSSNDDSGSDTTGSDDTVDGDGGDTRLQIPTEISHCQWSVDGNSNYAFNSTHLGFLNICQATTSETDIYIQVKDPITDAQVCLIPNHTGSNGSVYIGEPRCLMLTSNMRIYKASLLKNRTNFQNLELNALMVMKDKAVFYPPPFYQYVLSPDAYLFCSQHLDRTGDPSYCEAFRERDQYYYHQF